jgi:predicted RNase H-like HicB family nuclease
VPHGESRAELEQCLTVAIGQFVEDRPTRGIGQCLEDIAAHIHTIGK